MASHYKQRLENHLLEILADLLDREAKDPRVEGVVLTAVELNEDLSVAKVFYMAPAGKDDDAQTGLRRATVFLRREVGRFLKMKTSPELRFQEDRSLDRYNRIDSLLDADEKGAGGPPAPAGGEPED